MILFATNNLHKLKEVQDILPDLKIVSLKDMNIKVDPDENGVTYEENALIKAREIAKYTDLPVLADDSGLEIESMPNELGLHTARFHKELTQVEKNKLVVKTLEGKENRNAKFVCCAVLLINGKEYKYTYECHGSISTELRGTGGFGFNPVFIPNGFDITYAEMDDDTKYSISHRGVAMRKLVELVLKAGEVL